MNRNLIVASVVLLAGVSAFAYAQTSEIKTVPPAAEAAPAGAPATAATATTTATPAPAAAPAPVSANESPAPAAAPGAASAKAMIATRIVGQKCRLVSSGTVNISFNDLRADADKLQGLMEDKVKAIEALGQEAGVKKLNMQSMNYSANSRNYNGSSCGGDNGGEEKAPLQFQANGNINFKVEPATSAPAFAAALVKKGYNASFNVNKYRQCGNFAPNSADADDIDEGEE